MTDCQAHRACTICLGALFVLVVLYAASLQPSGPPRSELIDALECLRRRDYERAAPLFAACAAAGGDAGLCLAGRAECLFYLKQYDEALTACEELRQALPSSGRAAMIKGLVYRQQGRNEEATELFRVAARHGERAALTLLPKGE